MARDDLKIDKANISFKNVEFLKAKIGIKSIESLDEEFKIIKHFATGREKRNYKKCFTWKT